MKKVVKLFLILAVFMIFSTGFAWANPSDAAKKPYNPERYSWDTYRDNTNGISFSYPENWVLSAELVRLADITLPKTKIVTIQNPESGFTLTYYGGIVAYCSVPKKPVTTIITAVTPLKNTGSKEPVYLVESGSNIALHSPTSTDQFSIPKVGKKLGGYFYPDIRSKDICVFSTEYMFPANYAKPITSKNQADVKVGRQILSSVRFFK